MDKLLVFNFLLNCDFHFLDFALSLFILYFGYACLYYLSDNFTFFVSFLLILMVFSLIYYTIFTKIYDNVFYICNLYTVFYMCNLYMHKIYDVHNNLSGQRKRKKTKHLVSSTKRSKNVKKI